MKSLFGCGILLALSAALADAPKLSAPDGSYRGSVVEGVPQAPAAVACVKLVRSEPFQPDESPLPQYPDAAKEKHIEGDVAFHFEIGSGCATEEIAIDGGPEMLREPVANAVKNWKYCGVPEGQEIHATVAFRLSCPAK